MAAPADLSPLQRLLVCYDDTCAWCVQCRAWLEAQPTWLPVDFLPARSAQARQLAGHLPLGGQIVILGDDGSAWVGEDAFLVCLWATRRYRTWARQLARSPGRFLARRLFAAVSSRRERFTDIPAHEDCGERGCAPHPPA